MCVNYLGWGQCGDKKGKSAARRCCSSGRFGKIFRSLSSLDCWEVKSWSTWKRLQQSWERDKLHSDFHAVSNVPTKVRHADFDPQWCWPEYFRCTCCRNLHLLDCPPRKSWTRVHFRNVGAHQASSSKTAQNKRRERRFFPLISESPPWFLSTIWGPFSLDPVIQPELPSLRYLESRTIILRDFSTASAMFSMICLPGMKSLWWRTSWKPSSSSRIGVRSGYPSCMSGLWYWSVGLSWWSVRLSSWVLSCLYFMKICTIWQKSSALQA